MGRKKKPLKGQLFYDFFYNQKKENFSDEEIEKKLRSKAFKKYRKKTIKSGRLLEVEIYPIWSINFLKRGIKKNSTPEKQKKQNQKNKIKNINRKIHANFGDGDLWLTVGYGAGQEPKTDEEAYKNIKNYISRLRTLAKKEGKELKYIYVTEKSSKGRYHHHIICNSLNRDDVEKKWKFGAYPQARKIKDDGEGLEGLANYICKEIKEQKNKKTYVCSKNLKEPIITISDSTVSKRKVKNLALDENNVIEYAIKEYDGCNFLSSKILYSNYCDGAYIYLKMIKRKE